MTLKLSHRGHFDIGDFSAKFPETQGEHSLNLSTYEQYGFHAWCKYAQCFFLLQCDTCTSAGSNRSSNNRQPPQNVDTWLFHIRVEHCFGRDVSKSGMAQSFTEECDPL